MLKRAFLALALALAPLPAFAQSSKLSLLSAGVAITGTDLFYDVQTAGTGGVKITAAQLLTYMQAGVLNVGTTAVTGGSSGQCLTISSGLLGSAACGSGGAPGAPTSSLQYNNASAFGGISGASSNGTTVTFSNSDLLLLGSSTGATTFTSANAGASNFTLTIPANTGTIAETNLAQTFSAAQTFNSGNLVLAGATSGTTTLIPTAAASGTATFPANTGTVAELNLAQTWPAIQTFSVANGIVYSGATTGTQVACLGLDASNNVIKSAAACGSGGGGTPGGTSGQIQYNNASAFGGFGFTDASANTAIVNGTTAQNFHVYNTESGGTLPTPTNYERAAITWSSNLLVFGTQQGGTGSTRDIQISSPNNNIYIGNATAANGNSINGSMWFWNTTMGAGTGSSLLITGTGTNVIRMASGINFGWSSGDPSTLGTDTAFNRVATNLVEVNNGTAAGVAQLRLNGQTIASLPGGIAPACNATYLGARATVNNSSQTLSAGIGAIISTTTGTNIVPVFCDGTNWRIG
jgi:hypothetical protein